MAAKHCNLSLASIWFGGTYELDPWVRCWWPVLAWCTGWFELAGMQYQGSLISWFRIARGIPRETVGHEGRHNQTCPRYELDRVWLLLHLRLRPDLPRAYSLSKSPLWITCHMITERSSHGIITSGLWICHMRETSELCALCTPATSTTLPQWPWLSISLHSQGFTFFLWWWWRWPSG